MSDPVSDALAVLLERLAEAARGDSRLREAIVALARAVVAQSEGVAPAAAAPPPPPATLLPVPDASPVAPAALAPVAAPPPPPVALPPLTFAVAPVPPLPSAAPVPSSSPQVPDEELVRIERRARLKAEGCRWAARRQRLIESNADVQTEVEPVDRDLIARAKALPDCFLWMNNSSAPMPARLEEWDQVAHAFDVLASAVALARRLAADGASPDALTQAMEHLAQAQSALRVCVQELGASDDHDQYLAYQWLRSATSRWEIYVARHMRLNDPADPRHLDDLDAHINALAASLDDSRRRESDRRSLLNRIRFHIKSVKTGRASRRDWDTIASSVADLLKAGMPPSSVELREALLAVVDDMPDGIDSNPSMRLVLREIDRFLSSRATDAADDDRAAALAPEVRQVADLLAGRSVVLIGGERRNHARDALVRAFGLAELDWVATAEHESVATFESHIARPEVAVVVLAIRWSSHSFGEVKAFCDVYNKPLVRLPGGYNSKQVAAQILLQCSERLNAAFA